MSDVSSSEKKTMDPEAKAKWLPALRGGQYQQGKSLLHSDGRYCCLGVLHEVCSGAWDEEDEDGDYSVKGEFCLLADGMYGLDEPTMQHLAKMNDDLDKSFVEIADYIEANL